MSQRPKFVEVIESRGESVTARNARIEREAEARRQSQAKQEQLEQARKVRRANANKIAERKCNALQELLGASPLTSMIEQAVTALGFIREDNEGVYHDAPGLPKKVGAWKTGHNYWWWGHETDLSKPEGTVVKSAFVTNYINYCRRETRPLGKSAYVIARYAVVMSMGEITDNIPVVWHGELPQLETGKKHAHSAKFKEGLDNRMKAQSDELIERNCQKADFIPRVIREAVLFDPANPKSVIGSLDDGITEFAGRRFVPIAEQPIF